MDSMKPKINRDTLGIVSFLEPQPELGKGDPNNKPLVQRVLGAKNRDQLVTAILQRKSSKTGLLSSKGPNRQKNPNGFEIPPPPSQEEIEDKEKLEGVDWSKEGMPNTNEWEEEHQNDISHYESNIERLGFKDIYNEGLEAKVKAEEAKGEVDLQPYIYRYKGASQRLNDELNNPEGLVLHPAVQPLTLGPAELASTGADFEVTPPEPIAPQPPYLFPSQSSGQFDYNVPPEYTAFYPKSGQMNVPTNEVESKAKEDCIPVKDLPYIRALAPSKLADTACVPSKFLPFYHPTGTPQIAENRNPPGTSEQSLQPMIASPQYDLPMPFAHGPMFPAFQPPGPGQMTINPPPMVPLPAPADYNGNARRMPAMPMPPLPPAMWPYG